MERIHKCTNISRVTRVVKGGRGRGAGQIMKAEW